MPIAARVLVAAGLVALASGQAAAADLHELRSVTELRQRFNADAGKVRLVLLMSPT
jgi:hypothetical protein